MNLQPPTDNLYKFLAIGGLLAAIGCRYLAVTESVATFDQRLQLEQEFNDLLRQFHDEFGNYREAPLDPSMKQIPFYNSLAFGVHTASSDDERQSIANHLERHSQELIYLSCNPRKDQETEDFWKSHFGLTDAQLDEWTTGEESKAKGINKSASSFRQKFERTILIAERIWAGQDLQIENEIIYYYGSLTGIMASVLGFLLWYFFVQQLQDRILFLDRIEKEKKFQQANKALEKDVS